jgi:two-component system, OmpR family, sensor histidine kinase CreC
VDVAALLAGVVEDAAGQLESHELTAKVTMRAATDAALRGDGYLLRQAIANLLDNAIAFSPRGAAIELVARAGEAGQLVIEVRDQGPGVPDYALSRVFERFYSLPRPATGRKSSGLGLAFVREVARLHGGTAELGNGEGDGESRGAVAVLRLPLG